MPSNALKRLQSYNCDLFIYGDILSDRSKVFIHILGFSGAKPPKEQDEFSASHGYDFTNWLQRIHIFYKISLDTMDINPQ